MVLLRVVAAAYNSLFLGADVADLAGQMRVTLAVRTLYNS